MIQEWSKEKLRERYPYCTYIPDLVPSPELSYILGVRYGDLNVRNYNAVLIVKDKDFAEEFARCSEVIMKRPYVVSGRYRVIVGSKALCDFLKLPLLEAHSYWIEEYPAEFLRGFFDSEGSPNIKPFICVSNCNKSLLYYVNRLLDIYFDIKSTVTTPPSSIKRVGKIRPIISRKVSHILRITGLDNVEKFLWEIGFSIQRKNEVLIDGLYNTSHPRWRSKYL